MSVAGDFGDVTEAHAQAVVELLRQRGATNLETTAVALAVLVNHLIAEGIPLGRALRSLDVMYGYRLVRRVHETVLVRPL